MVHHLYPDTHLIFTEGCVELTDSSVDKDDKSGYLGAWGNGERYGRNIIGDFNNYSEGWIDWNLLLNEQGGPNHVENYCEAPIMYNRQTKCLIYNNSYYYIGHFSRYIDIGAKRIKTQVSGENLHAVSFINNDGKRVVVVQNEGHVAKVTLVVDGLGAELSLANNSINTFVFGE
jgi:glucosylceramidase